MLSQAGGIVGIEALILHTPGRVPGACYDGRRARDAPENARWN